MDEVKEICIDYAGSGDNDSHRIPLWIAWDKNKGVDNFPRLSACGNPARLYVIMSRQYPNAKIHLSDAAEMLQYPVFNEYVGSSLHQHDASDPNPYWLKKKGQ